MDQQELTGTLFDIQGFSVHDGPGCRTLIFFKGCPLSCRWCSNPEGKKPFPEPLYRKDKCVFDNLCIDACPNDAIRIDREKLAIERSVCAGCENFICTDACCTGALQKAGYFITLKQLDDLISRDRQYWRGNGGITLTGGEPFFQPEFAIALLKVCHEKYIHTAAETCGQVKWSNYEAVIPYLDWLFFDIKHMDPVRHREGTGHPNTMILDNARRLSTKFPGRMVFRMTVIPGYNDQNEHIHELADFILETGRKEINILPVHHLGREKYELLGQEYFTSDFTSPSQKSMKQISDLLESKRISCYVGSDTPF